jgi:hypothetical protein
MIKVMLTEEQIKFLLDCLDLQLKTKGLAVIHPVVALSNALAVSQREIENENKKEEK